MARAEASAEHFSSIRHTWLRWTWFIWPDQLCRLRSWFWALSWYHPAASSLQSSGTSPVSSWSVWESGYRIRFYRSAQFCTPDSPTFPTVAEFSSPSAFSGRTESVQHQTALYKCSAASASCSWCLLWVRSWPRLHRVWAPFLAAPHLTPCCAAAADATEACFGCGPDSAAKFYSWSRRACFWWQGKSFRASGSFTAPQKSVSNSVSESLNSIWAFLVGLSSSMKEAVSVDLLLGPFLQTLLFPGCRHPLLTGTCSCYSGFNGRAG